MYLQVAGMRGALLRFAIRCKPVKVKNITTILGWNISKNVEMIFDLFDNSD